MFQKVSLKRRKIKHLHKLIKGREVRASRSKPEGLDFVQVAESKKLTVEEINNSIDDELKNTIAEIPVSETVTIEVNSQSDESYSSIYLYLYLYLYIYCRLAILY